MFASRFFLLFWFLLTCEHSAGFFFFFLKKCSVFMIDFLFRCVYVLILACWLRFRYFFFSPSYFCFAFWVLYDLLDYGLILLGLLLARPSVHVRFSLSFLPTGVSSEMRGLLGCLVWGIEGGGRKREREGGRSVYILCFRFGISYLNFVID